MTSKYIIASKRLYSQLIRQVLKMDRNTPTYQAAVDTLNKLQTNAEYLKNAGVPNVHNHEAATKLDEVRKYLSRIGLTRSLLNDLSVIHVAGTKGKGTTCALCESILRHHGYKTGFFSSPHLIEVRERIRVNGKPISRGDFAQEFFEVYNKLEEQKDGPDDMPLYFRFLTIMAFQYFLKQKVDVAVIEVGIGGEYDCTNVLRKVPVVGITSLGIDHTQILGNTLEAIAWQKAGIMKKGSQAFTVPQPEEALKVLKERSIEKECPLNIVDERLHFPLPDVTGIPENVFSKNASLAVALADAWIKSNNGNGNGLRNLCPELTKTAIKHCRWPGRFQIKQIQNIRFFLDGAHTIDSIRICRNWYMEMVKNCSAKKALIFNITGQRDPQPLLLELMKCCFDVVIFVRNAAGKNDNADVQMQKCQRHKEIWLCLEDTDPTVPKAKRVETYASVFEAIESLKDEEYAVLITGSIHLIGCTLSLIDPDINDNGDGNCNLFSHNSQ